MAVKLSDKLISKLTTPAAGSAIVWDSEVGGLGLRTTAERVQSFVLNYRTATGVERRLTIGRFSDWTVAAARDEAKALKRRIDRSEDPLRAEKELREAPDVAALAERYLREWSPRKSALEQKRERVMIEADILPVIGKLKVAAVTPDDVHRVFARITKRAAPIRANRTAALLSKMFALAETQWGWRPANLGNPVKGLARNAETKRERFLSGEEIGRLVEALRTYPTAAGRQNEAVARDPLRCAAQACQLSRPEPERLVLRHDLRGEPAPAAWSAQVLVGAGRDQMTVQDRLDDVLQPGARRV
jgi:hypothetical protein